MTYITDIQKIELYHIRKCIEFYRTGEMKPETVDKFISDYKTKYELEGTEFHNHFKEFVQSGGLENIVKGK